MKRFFKEFAKLLVTAGLLYYLFRKVPAGKVIQTIKGMDLLYLFIPIILFFIYYGFFALRWRFLLSSQNISVSPRMSYLYMLVSFFFNNFLPSGVGMDIVRSGYAGGREKFESAFGASIVERMLGMIGLMFIGLFAIFWMHHEFIKFFFIYLGLILLIGLVYFLFVSVRAKWLKEKLLSIKFLNLGKSLRDFYLSIKTYRNKGKTITIGIGYSILVQMVIICINFFLVRGLSINLPLSSLIAYLPIITIFSLIPITINGLGMREYAYVLFFSSLGVAKEGPLSLSLLFFATSVIASSIGGIVFIFLKKPQRKEKL